MGFYIVIVLPTIEIAIIVTLFAKKDDSEE